MSRHRPILILGPTAGGKSALAVGLAERLGGEVVGADAFQIYRRLDAGTAKPDAELRRRAPHHLIDIVEPTGRFTVHDWLRRARAVIADIQSRERTPIIVGGTNLYLKALLEGMFEGPGQDPCFRASLDGIQTPQLHARLKQVDPPTAERVKPADRQRIVRALEVHALTGRPISALQTQWADSGPTARPAADSPTLIGLRWSPEAINPRINLRVKAMFYPDKVDPELAAAVCINGESLIDEVQRLREQGAFEPISGAVDASESAAHAGDPRSPNQAREALGYKQLLAWIEGSNPKIASLDDAFEKTKVLTRRFAKQQRTWLKRFTEARWIEAEGAIAEELSDQAVRLISVNQ